MPRFDTAAVVEDTVWTMRLGDYSRSLNRARINDLFNGVSPYTDQEVKENNIAVNVNFLEPTKLAHDARRQFANAFTKPGNFFTITEIDRGAHHKRRQYATTVTKAINRCMKRSLPYFETIRSTFANVVLHGIGPVIWEDREHWVPDPLGVEDVLVPSNTFLTMKNLPFFAIFRPYTALQLWKLTHGPKVDPAWNMSLVNKCIEHADKQILDFGLPYSEIYSPEKMAERFKSDSGLYSSDSVPTIDAWDFYFFNDDGDESGWNRRIVLDANWQLGISGIASHAVDKPKVKDLTSKVGVRGEFLYNSGDRVYATKRDQITHFQFGDLSAVAPFRYHSVRSLGFLLFALCHLQNRLRCKFNDALLEHMLQYFRVRNLDEVERALKINLVEKGFIDETVQFIPQNERWQVDAGLIQMGLAHNRELMGQNASSYVQDYDFGRERANKTATEVMAEVNSTTALVSAALAQAYEYQKFQYYEIARRFSRKNSRDPDVRKFRLEVLKAGVPEEVIDSECWEIEPERVMGSGNKMLEIAMADKLMAARNLYDPEPQRDILRDYTLAVTDDPGRTDRLVPEQPVRVTDSVHDAQLASAALMMGLRVDIKTGMNHIEYVDTMLGEMQLMLQKIMSTGGANPNQIIGLQNMAQHISGHIQIIAQDTNEKQRVKQYGDALGQIMNQVKALAQQMQQRMQAQQQAGNGGIDPKDAAKIQAVQLMAEVKAESARQSNAQRTAQRQTQHELAAQRDADKHAAEMEKKLAETQTDVAAKDLETAAKISRDNTNGTQATLE